MNFTIKQLEHISRALKLYSRLWNSVSGIPKSLKISEDENEDIEKLIENIKNEIMDRKLHE
jgi:hypothetical protein